MDLDKSKVSVNEFFIDKDDHIVIVGADFGAAEAAMIAAIMGKDGHIFIDEIKSLDDINIERMVDKIIDMPVPETKDLKPVKHGYDWREGRNNIRKPRR